MIFTLTLGLASLIVISRAAPHINHLEERQTYTITCIGPKCTDYPPTTINISTRSISFPPGIPNPTTSAKITSAKPSSSSTSKKTSSTSKTTLPSPPKPPTKTVDITVKPSTTKGEETGPSSTRCPVPLYYQCGGYYDGKPWTGCKKCVSGATCVQQNEFYYQCVADE